MMTSENYTTRKKYKVEGATSRLYDKENNIKDTTAYIDDSAANACETTDISNTENASETSRRSRTRRSRDQISDETSRNSEEMQVEGATASAEKPKSLKKEKASGKKRKERKNLREKRRSTGVVIMPGLGVSMNFVCRNRSQQMCAFILEILSCLFRIYDLIYDLLELQYDMTLKYWLVFSDRLWPQLGML